MKAQVEAIKGRSNLLLWYTADEPDGWQHPLNSTSIASHFIKSIDPYHPVSLVLNCFDYYFSEYTLDADIVMQDAYPIGINATHSTVWDTEVRMSLSFPPFPLSRPESFYLIPFLWCPVH